MLGTGDPRCIGYDGTLAQEGQVCQQVTSGRLSAMMKTCYKAQGQRAAAKSSRRSKHLGLVQVEAHHHNMKEQRLWNQVATVLNHSGRFIILCEIQLLHLLNGIIIHLARKLPELEIMCK